MPYYEIVYETGEHSIACYADDTECLEACGEQHRRATAGEKASSTRSDGPPATRIVRIFKYEDHPADFNVEQRLPAVQIKEMLDRMSKGKDQIVSVQDLVGRLRDAVQPLEETKPHESNYKMEQEAELSLPWIGKVEG